MSDYIPFEIQSEIIKRLPVKSVVQGRSVSKRWKSLIDSSDFITSYHICRTPKQHLFVRYKSANEVKYVSIIDDDTFPNHKSPLTVPKPVSLLGHILSVNSVNGVLCLYGWRQDVIGEKIAVLWNPSVGKAVGITISNPLPPNRYTRIGFGVCPNTRDAKLVRINTSGVMKVLNWEVEVFTLSARVWKSVTNIPPAFKTCILSSDCVFVEGSIYWSAFDTINGVALGFCSLIISFDLKSDEFGVVSLPGRVRMKKFTISNVYDSLGLFEYDEEGETRFCDVWIMKEKSFTKMLSIKAPDSWGVHYRVLELRHNGEAIIQNTDHTYSSELEVYEPSSGRSSGVGINGRFNSFLVNSYMETLLLLDESDSIIH